MSKLLATLVAALFAVATAAPTAFAQDQKKAQVHKGTPEQGTVQKKEQKKAQKKDGTGAAKKGDGKKAAASKEEKK
jgi:hypothetical protein